jgi:hypothetical protein
MRRRSSVTIALIAAFGSVVALAGLGTAVATRSNIDAGSVQRVTEPAGVVVATARSITAPIRTIRTVLTSTTPSAPMLSLTALWSALVVSLVIPAGSLVQPTRRRAPPLVVI